MRQRDVRRARRLPLGWLALGALAGCLQVGVARAGERAPAPRLDRIDYGRPDAQRDLGPSLGVGQRARGIANQLKKKGAQPLETLTRIARWVDRNLKSDPDKRGDWRTVDQILSDGTLGGLADRALVIGALARSAAIPTTWVKSLPTAWLIRAKTRRAALGGEEGHVFLEVHLAGRWQLFDPDNARLYETYDPKAVLLPGGQLAFDKGGDPYALVLPSRSRLFREQVAAYVKALDLSRVPWAKSRDLLARWRVYILGTGKNANYARATAQAFGYDVEKTFHGAFERNLPAARGKTLIVVCHKRDPLLPAAYRDALLPKGYEKALSGEDVPAKGWLARKLEDGTRVILVVADGYEAVEMAVSEALDA